MDVSVHITSREGFTDLRAPPPFTGVHVMVHPNRFILVYVVTLWCNKQVRGKVTVAPQRTDTLDDITGIQMEYFAVDNDFRAGKFRATREFFVYDSIELRRRSV